MKQNNANPSNTTTLECDSADIQSRERIIQFNGNYGYVLYSPNVLKVMNVLVL